MSKLRFIQASLLSNHRLEYSSIPDGLCYAKQKMFYTIKKKWTKISKKKKFLHILYTIYKMFSVKINNS